jgi:hypothetical protein
VERAWPDAVALPISQASDVDEERTPCQRSVCRAWVEAVGAGSSVVDQLGQCLPPTDAFHQPMIDLN